MRAISGTFAWATAKPPLPTLRKLWGYSRYSAAATGRVRRLLVLAELIENTARLDHAGVGVDVGLRRIGNDQQIALLPCSTD
jgi:hypothetical protein